MSNLPAIKSFSDSPAVKGKIEKVFSGNAEAFMQTVFTICSESDALMKCSAPSIWKAAIKAANLNLSMDVAFGYAYIIPYGGEAQFQLGYKGLIQLAIRSGQYKELDCVPVFRDEIEEYNPITNKFKFKGGFNEKSERFTGGEPVGYYAYFELLSGYSKAVFMTNEQIRLHAQKYSKMYAADLKYNKKKSMWAKDFHAMAIKTPLKRLLSKFGPLSTKMQEAVISDTPLGAEIDDTPQTVEPKVVEAMEVETGTQEEMPTF